MYGIFSECGAAGTSGYGVWVPWISSAAGLQVRYTCRWWINFVCSGRNCHINYFANKQYRKMHFSLNNAAYGYES